MTERAKASSGGGRGPQRVLRLEVSETSSSGGGGAGRRGGGSVDRSESSGLSQRTGSSSSVTASDDVSTIDGGEEQVHVNVQVFTKTTKAMLHVYSIRNKFSN